MASSVFTARPAAQETIPRLSQTRLIRSTSSIGASPRRATSSAIASYTNTSATLETMGYGFNALLSSQSLAALDQTLLLRALLSPEDITDVAAGAIHANTLKGFAASFAEGIQSGRVVVLPGWAPSP